jgi:hypothetical protein
MNRKEALRYISEKIETGVPKHVIFKELSAAIPYKEDLLLYLAQVPDLENRKKYRNTNNVLLAVLVLLFLMQLSLSILIYLNIKSEHIAWLMLGGFGYTLLPILLLFTIIEVWRFRGQGYRFVFIASILALTLTVDSGKLVQWIIMSCPYILAIFLSHRIMKNVFPYDRVFRHLDSEKMEKDLLSISSQPDASRSEPFP